MCSDASNFPLAEFEFVTRLKCRLASFIISFRIQTSVPCVSLCVIMCICASAIRAASLVGVFSSDKYVLFAHCGFIVILKKYSIPQPWYQIRIKGQRWGLLTLLCLNARRKFPVFKKTSVK